MGFRSFIRNVIRRLLDENNDAVPNLRAAAEQMLQALDARSNAAALSMALADEAYGKLQRELENHEALGRQAGDFLRDGEEEAARRCVALQLESAGTVQTLTERYQTLQKQAEGNATAFRRQQKEAQDRVNQLPELEQDERLLAAAEKVADFMKISLTNPQSAFDRAMQEIRIRQRQLAGKEVLTSDPNAELDRRIREKTDQKKLDAAMAELRTKIGATETVDAEFTVVPNRDDPVSAARKLLEAPRYAGLALPNRREPLPIPRGGR